MNAPAASRRVVDLDALAEQIAGSLQDPTYALDEDVAPDGFVRFTTETTSGFAMGVDDMTVRATVNLVSDGKDEVAGAAGEVVEIIVRRVSA